MARGYSDSKYRGGSDTKKTDRAKPKDAKRQTNRKTHDTNKTKR